MSPRAAKSKPGLAELLRAGRIDEFVKRALELEPADLADVLSSLDEDERLTAVRALPPEVSGEALVEMPEEEHAEDTLAALEPEQAADIVDEMADDDAADILQELEPEEQERILSEVEDRSDVDRLLAYDEESAGGLMTTHVVTVFDTVTAGEAIEEIRRQAEEMEGFYQVFVVDPANRLVGLLPLNQLVTSPPDRSVREFMEPAEISVTPDRDQEEVARLMARYNVPSVPVVDGNGIGPVVTFAGRAAGACTLSGLLITGGKGDGGAAVSCVGADPVLAHCVIAGNMAIGATGAILSFEDSNAVMIHCTVTENLGDFDSALLGVTDCNVAVSNCIFWNNFPATIRTVSGLVPGITYSDTTQAGLGNFSLDPLFAVSGYWNNGWTPADPSDDVWVPGDYHLSSAKGRFRPDHMDWVSDEKNSPCIDAGDPASPVGDEPTPNGGRVNLGAYGGTSQASRSN